MIYFDSAATTLQKPYTVPKAAAAAISTLASPGRGGYPAAARASALLLACREEAADLFGVPAPENVILTFNATHGLNIAVKSLVKPGHTVLITGYEHNAVTRPLASIPGVTVRNLRAPLFRPDVLLSRLERELRAGADGAIFTHVSNVFGYVLPIGEMAALCRRYEVPFLVDASQSAGALPVSLADWGAEFVAFPGHKGLYGPQGTGLLLCRASAEPILEGGTGSASRLPGMPDFLPDRLEAGTHNVTGAAGLLEGMRFVRRKGLPSILRHETALKEMAAEGLKRLPGVQVFHRREPSLQSGVLSFRLERQDAGQTADYLARNGVAVRAGLHCAPTAHETAGTVETGTVRVSFSAFNNRREVERFLSLMERMA